MAFPVPIPGESRRDRYLQSQQNFLQAMQMFGSGLGAFGRALGPGDETERLRREALRLQVEDAKRRQALETGEQERLVGLAAAAERPQPVPKPVEIPGMGEAPPPQVPGAFSGIPIGPAMAQTGPFSAGGTMPPPAQTFTGDPKFESVWDPASRTHRPNAAFSPQVPGAGPVMGQIGETPEPWQQRKRRADLLRQQAYSTGIGDTAGARQFGEQIAGLGTTATPEDVRADQDLIAALEGATPSAWRTALGQARSPSGRRAILEGLSKAVDDELAEGSKKETRTYNEGRTEEERRYNEGREDKEDAAKGAASAKEAEDRRALNDALIKGTDLGKLTLTTPKVQDELTSAIKWKAEQKRLMASQNPRVKELVARSDRARKNAAVLNQRLGRMEQKTMFGMKAPKEGDPNFAEYQKLLTDYQTATDEAIRLNEEAGALEEGGEVGAEPGFTTRESPADIQALSDEALLARYKSSTDAAEKAILKAERDRRIQGPK